MALYIKDAAGNRRRIAGAGPKGDPGPPAQDNFLVNWYFPYPINQRGIQSGAPWGSYTYGIDMWRSFDSGRTKWVEGEGIYLSPVAGSTNAIIDQRFEINQIEDGSIVTLSALVNDDLVSFTTTFNHGSDVGKDVLASGITVRFQLRSTDPGDGVGTYRIWALVAGDVTIVKAVKLELGSTQTLARKDADGNWVLNAPPPNYQQELAKCQRYFIELVNRKSYGLIGNGIAYQDNFALVFIPLPVTLRSNPSIFTSGKFVLNNYKTVLEVDRIELDNLTSNGINVKAFTKSGQSLVRGEIYSLWGYNNIGPPEYTPYIGISSDL